MTEMVERVARALAARKCGLVKDPYGERLPDDLWQQCIPDARAAIEAMREPTDKMLDAGPPFPYMDKGVWQAMIDAALSEP